MQQIPLIKPMLAVSKEPFDSADYLYEIKWDGHRGMVYLEKGAVNVRSRNLQDITGTFPELQGIAKNVKRQPVLLDGEIIVLRNGQPSFDALQGRGRMRNRLKILRAADSSPALFVAFDILYVEGTSLIEQQLRTRKELLEQIVSPGENIIVSKYILEKGKQFFTACGAKGLEGAMAKRLDSTYLPGKRSPAWVKFRYTREADLVICGYQAGQGGRILGSLILGGYRQGKLLYQGKVGTGFSSQEEQQLYRLLQEFRVSCSALDLPREERGRTIWVRPCLVCQVNYLAVTDEGRLRHASFKGLRTDKDCRDCISLY